MIELFLCDVDATLTDGIYHTTDKGEVSKNFFTRDFHGLWMLFESGVKIGIITAGSDDVIDHQCRRCAKYAEIIKGTKDKFFSIEEKYIQNSKLSWNEVCYIGDDVFDIPLLLAVGVAACPADADQAVWKVIENRHDGFVSDFPGGKGCVREFADHILRINNVESGRP